MSALRLHCMQNLMTILSMRDYSVLWRKNSYLPYFNYFWDGSLLTIKARSHFRTLEIHTNYFYCLPWDPMTKQETVFSHRIYCLFGYKILFMVFPALNPVLGGTWLSLQTSVLLIRLKPYSLLRDLNYWPWLPGRFLWHTYQKNGHFSLLWGMFEVSEGVSTKSSVRNI